MSNMTTLSVVDAERITTHGLAPVICYDPYYRRMVRYLRHIVADGHPALIRLHSAAQYPAGDKSYQVDIEGHAVLVVGYDDERQAFAVADPWDKTWGGAHGGQRWIDYNELAMIIVDASKGITDVLAPLEVDAEEVTVGGGRWLRIEAGFYSPKAIVMDQDNQEIRAVRAVVSGGDSEADAEVQGHWLVGQKATLMVKLPETMSGHASVAVTAVLAGKRPYDYEDRIGVELEVDVSQAVTRRTVAA